MTETFDKKIIRMGASLGVTIPPGWLRFNNIQIGDMVEMIVDKEIKISPKGGKHV